MVRRYGTAFILTLGLLSSTNCGGKSETVIRGGDGDAAGDGDGDSSGDGDGDSAGDGDAAGDGDGDEPGDGDGDSPTAILREGVDLRSPVADVPITVDTSTPLIDEDFLPPDEVPEPGEDLGDGSCPSGLEFSANVALTHSPSGMPIVVLGDALSSSVLLVDGGTFDIEFEDIPATLVSDVVYVETEEVLAIADLGTCGIYLVGDKGVSCGSAATGVSSLTFGSTGYHAVSSASVIEYSAETNNWFEIVTAPDGKTMVGVANSSQTIYGVSRESLTILV